VLRVGDRVRFDGQVQVVAGLAGTTVRLQDEAGGASLVLCSHLLASDGFELLDSLPAAPGLPSFGLLDTVPEPALRKARFLERHLVEAETGVAPDAGPNAPIRPEYDPKWRTVNERLAAKAEELTAMGTAASVVRTLAKAVLALDEEIAGIDLQIAARFREHRDAEVIVSVPGMGPLLGAEFIACTGGDMNAFGSTGRLAGVAGLARSQGIQDGSAATCVGHTATTADCCASSTSLRRSPRASAPRRKRSTTASELRERATSRRFSPSPADASTSCGLSYAISEPSRHCPLHAVSPRTEPAAL
jgi:hypothetical protein